MREATLEDKQRVVAIIAQAFDQNDSVNYVVKQDKKRKLRIVLLIEYSFYQGIQFGKVLISENERAACILIFPWLKKTTFSSILWDMKLVIKVIGLKRVGNILKRERLLKKNHPKKRFCHLWYIGVDPAYQHRGIGSKLLEEILQTYNAMTFYLETSVSSNLRFYKKFDFEVIETIDLGYDLYVLKST